MSTTSEPVHLRRLDDLKIWDRNYNRGDVPAIRASIAEFGMNGALRVWQDGIVIAGNHALLALRDMRDAGELPPTHVTVDADGAWWIPCIDVTHLERRRAEAFAIADNRTRDLASTDDAALASLLSVIAEEAPDAFGATGYDDGDLNRLLAILHAGEESDVDAEPRFDKADELQEKWKVEPGQLWLLGDHRLLCGDSTKPEDVARVMNGQRARLFATDPPYLVDYDGTNHPSAKGDFPKRRAQKNKDWSDDYRDWDRSDQGDGLYRGFYAAAVEHAVLPDAAWYCWHASRRQAMLESVWAEFGAFVHQQLIWAKDRGVLGRTWYRYRHEPCFFGWVKGQKPPRVAEDYPTTVWDFPTSRVGEDTGHPTSKPVQLFEIPMLQHAAPGEICFEPFSGSGSQIIAGERTGRRVYAIEIAPPFVAVPLERFAEATGVTPTLAAA